LNEHTSQGYVPIFFLKSRCHLKILGVCRLTQNKLNISVSHEKFEAMQLLDNMGIVRRLQREKETF
jgi:hypothetical protein